MSFIVALIANGRETRIDSTRPTQTIFMSPF